MWGVSVLILTKSQHILMYTDDKAVRSGYDADSSKKVMHKPFCSSKFSAHSHSKLGLWTISFFFVLFFQHVWNLF